MVCQTDPHEAQVCSCSLGIIVPSVPQISGLVTRTSGSGATFSGSPATGAGGTSTLPLANARRRLQAKHRQDTLGRSVPIKKPRMDVKHQGRMVALRAEGLTQRQIGHALGVSTPTVARFLKQPENQVELLQRREFLKGYYIHHATRVAEPAWQMAHEAAVSRDSKSFDNTVRGLVGMEKIASSVSGESLRVEHSGIPSAPPQTVIEELKILLQLVNGNGADQSDRATPALRP